MKNLIFFAILLLATLASAETVIIEYPDHFYVESTGSPNEKPAASAESNAPASRPAPVPSRESISSTEKTEETEERRKALAEGIERLQREQKDLAVPREGETPDQVNSRQQEAYGKLKKLKRMSSELQKLTDQKKEKIR